MRSARRMVGAATAVLALTTLPAAPAGAEARGIALACPEGEVPESGFTDTVELGEAQQAAIDCIVSFEIARGTTATTYGPSEPVTRGQMASFLQRTVAVAAPDAVPADPPDAFSDDDGSTHEAAIDAVAALGIARGTSATTFEPDATVTRAQMASFVVGAIGVVTGAAVGDAPPDAFTDDDGTTHETNIDALAQVRIVSGVAAGTYAPDAPVTRSQMALFLARTLDHLAEEGFLAGPGATALTVVGEVARAEVGTTRACTVSAPADATLHLRLLPAAAITSAEDGSLRFADADGDGRADTPLVVPSISSVGGNAQPADTIAVDDVPGGELEVVLGSSGQGEVVLVAFVDGDLGTARALDVDPDGAPVDTAAAGCRTAFVPPEALQGRRAGVVVRTVGADGSYFTGAPAGSTQATYVLDDADLASGKATSVESLRALLSAGDVLDVDYDPAPAAPSSFDVIRDTVAGTSTPVARAIDSGADGSVDDVRIAFVPPAHNGAGTVYRIARVSTHATSDGRCSMSIAATGTTVGTTAESPFVDLGVPKGCWIYRTIAASPTGATAVSPFSAPVRTPGDPADTTRPRSVHAGVVDDGDGVLGVGDVIRLAFDETMAAPVAGATLTVTAGGQSVTFTDGKDAGFTLVQVTMTVGGTSRPPRTVIEVRPTTAPVTALPHPTTITAHTGIADVAGNPWDVAQSPDRTLDSTT